MWKPRMRTRTKTRTDTAKTYCWNRKQGQNQGWEQIAAIRTVARANTRTDCNNKKQGQDQILHWSRTRTFRAKTRTRTDSVGKKQDKQKHTVGTQKNDEQKHCRKEENVVPEARSWCRPATSEQTQVVWSSCAITDHRAESCRTHATHSRHICSWSDVGRLSCWMDHSTICSWQKKIHPQIRL